MRSPRSAAVLFAGLVFAHSSAASALDPTIQVGLGLPELTHIRIGAFVNPRLSAELYASNVIFNWLTGVSATGYFLGDARPDGPPPHALLVQGTVALNPLANPVRVRGGGETIAAAAMVNGGYAWTSDTGFMFHATAGAFIYLENTVAVAPNFALSVGFKF